MALLIAFCLVGMWWFGLFVWWMVLRGKWMDR